MDEEKVYMYFRKIKYSGRETFKKEPDLSREQANDLLIKDIVGVITSMPVENIVKIKYRKEYLTLRIEFLNDDFLMSYVKEQDKF